MGNQVAARPTTPQFIEKLQEKHPDMSQANLRAITSDVLDLIDEMVPQYGSLTLFRRTFKLRVHPAHVGRNPKNGTQINIPEIKSVVYRKRLS